MCAASSNCQPTSSASSSYSWEKVWHTSNCELPGSTPIRPLLPRMKTRHKMYGPAEDSVFQSACFRVPCASSCATTPATSSGRSASSSKLVVTTTWPPSNAKAFGNGLCIQNPLIQRMNQPFRTVRIAEHNRSEERRVPPNPQLHQRHLAGDGI